MATAANWSTAAQSCHRLGADLTTVSDAFSQAFLQLFVAQSAGVHTASDSVPSVWIGLSDLQVRTLASRQGVNDRKQY